MTPVRPGVDTNSKHLTPSNMTPTRPELHIVPATPIDQVSPANRH